MNTRILSILLFVEELFHGLFLAFVPPDVAEKIMHNGFNDAQLPKNVLSGRKQ